MGIEVRRLGWLVASTLCLALASPIEAQPLTTSSGDPSLERPGGAHRSDVPPPVVSQPGVAASEDPAGGPDHLGESDDEEPDWAGETTDGASGAQLDLYPDTRAGRVAPPGQERGWEREPSVEPEDVLLFVPRVVFFVPKIVFTGVFWPIRELLEVVERYAVVEHVKTVLYWNDEQTVGWLPVISFFSPTGLTFGVNLFHHNLLGYDESLSLKARFGGRFNQAYEIAFEADRLAGSRVWLEARARYEISPRLRFSGIGRPDTAACGVGDQSPAETACPTYFEQDRMLGLLRLGLTFGHLGEQLQMGVAAVFNRRAFFGVPDEVEERSIEEVYQTAVIPGFDDGSSVLELLVNVVVDGRERRGLRASGVYFEAFGGYAPALESFEYVHYGAELAYAIDLFRSSRLLTLRAAVEAVHAGAGEIPFTDLPRLGGPNRLRGYEEDQFRDEIAGLASVEYHYPIHRNLSGELFVDVGQVAADYADLFDEVDRWVLGYGGGLLFGGADNVSFRFEVGVGDSVLVFLSSDLAFAFTDRSSQL